MHKSYFVVIGDLFPIQIVASEYALVMTFWHLSMSNSSFILINGFKFLLNCLKVFWIDWSMERNVLEIIWIKCFDLKERHVVCMKVNSGHPLQGVADPYCLLIDSYEALRLITAGRCVALLSHQNPPSEVRNYLVRLRGLCVSRSDCSLPMPIGRNCSPVGFQDVPYGLGNADPNALWWLFLRCLWLSWLFSLLRTLWKFVL